LATKGYKKSFTDAKKAALGPRAEDIIAEDRDTIRENRQRLREAEIQLKQAETLSSQREEEKKKVEPLDKKLRKLMLRLMKLGINMVRILTVKQSCVGSNNRKRTIKPILKTGKKLCTRSQKKQWPEKRNKPRLIDSGPASQQKKVKQTPWKKGSTKQNRWTP